VADVARRLRPASRSRDKREIAAHYDLGNDFFELFLDPTMAYSCGLFDGAEASLEDAQKAKFDRLLRSIDLGPTDHLVEIGTGWGGLAVHAATRFGARVTTTTISVEQHRYATDLVASLRTEAGRNPYDRDLSDLIGELSTRSQEFATRWAAHNVRQHVTGVKRLHHPIAGDLLLSYEVMELPADPGLSLAVYTAQPDSPTQDALRFLSSWADPLTQQHDHPTKEEIA
jgi:hypothetical protein